MRIVIFLIALLGAFPVAARAAWDDTMRPGAACGLERWSVKTLMDPQAAQIAWTPRWTSVPALVGLPAPADPDAIADRLGPVETTLWRVRAQLVGYRLERDSDVHLVLRDPQTGETMIGEVPAPYCTENRAAAARFARVRAEIARRWGAPERSWRWLDRRGERPPEVVVTGVGFFDRIHEQAGVARNGIELHPVVELF
jgi:hypothetical protein